jgi:fumarate reductase flavoprotein subunit
MTTDVDTVIVGAGAGGLVAALAVTDAGGSAVVVEKLDQAGGNSALSTGSIPGAGTRWQAEAGIADGPEVFAADLLRQSGPHDAEHLTRRLADVSAGLVEWLVDVHEVDLRLITDYKHVGHTRSRLHAPPSRKGDALMRDLLAACRRADVEVLLNNPVAGLIVDDDRVAGVTVAGERVSRYELRSSSVILAANGYAANKRLVERWAPDAAGADYFGAHGSTGEAIEWGTELGAGLANISAFQGYAAVAYPHGSLLTWTTVEKGGILIDRHGRRFGDESWGYSGYAAKVLKADQPAYVVFDAAIRDAAAAHEEEFRELVAMGGVREYPDAAGLAAFMGCSPSEIEGTLTAARAAAAGERPDEFGRSDFGNGPLRPPYAIIRTVPGLFHTQGGLRVDKHARVQRPDGTVITGLYAVGGTAAGVSGRSGGGGYSSGSGLLAAVGLGAIAGRHSVMPVPAR